MSLRIPLTPDQTLQVEFHEIERRLRRLEKFTKSDSTSIRVIGTGGTGAADLTSIYNRLAALEAAVAVDVPNLGPVGAAAQAGLAPSPGLGAPPTGVAQHLLTEDAEWGFPLRGLIGVATSGEQTSPPYDVVNLAAALTVWDVAAGNISAADASVRAFSGGITTTAASYTATTSDHVIRCNATSGNLTVTLPAAASCSGLILHVKKVDATAYYVRLDGNSSETIDGDATFDLLLEGENLMIQSNGTSWDVL